jgi:hypothetical protein
MCTSRFDSGMWICVSVDCLQGLLDVPHQESACLDSNMRVPNMDCDKHLALKHSNNTFPMYWLQRVTRRNPSGVSGCMAACQAPQALPLSSAQPKRSLLGIACG